jgi:hypothetical protein
VCGRAISRNDCAAPATSRCDRRLSRRVALLPLGLSKERLRGLAGRGAVQAAMGTVVDSFRAAFCTALNLQARMMYHSRKLRSGKRGEGSVDG